MINKIEFSAKNLTANASLFLLLEHANINGNLAQYLRREIPVIII
jgi:hypothetical protein